MATKGHKVQADDQRNFVKTEASGTDDRVRRPPNAFMVFAQEHRKKIALKNPSESNKNISTILGNMWKELSAVDKEKYYERARQIDFEHKRMYPGYVYNPKEARKRKELKASSKSSSHTLENERLAKNCTNISPSVASIVERSKKGSTIANAAYQQNWVNIVSKEIKKEEICKQVMKGMGIADPSYFSGCSSSQRRHIPMRSEDYHDHHSYASVQSPISKCHTHPMFSNLSEFSTCGTSFCFPQTKGRWAQKLPLESQTISTPCYPHGSGTHSLINLPYKGAATNMYPGYEYMPPYSGHFSQAVRGQMPKEWSMMGEPYSTNDRYYHCALSPNYHYMNQNNEIPAQHCKFTHSCCYHENNLATPENLEVQKNYLEHYTEPCITCSDEDSNKSISIVEITDEIESECTEENSEDTLVKTDEQAFAFAITGAVNILNDLQH